MLENAFAFLERENLPRPQLFPNGGWKPVIARIEREVLEPLLENKEGGGDSFYGRRERCAFVQHMRAFFMHGPTDTEIRIECEKVHKQNGHNRWADGTEAILKILDER